MVPEPRQDRGSQVSRVLIFVSMHVQYTARRTQYSKFIAAALCSCSVASWFGQRSRGGRKPFTLIVIIIMYGEGSEQFVQAAKPPAGRQVVSCLNLLFSVKCVRGREVIIICCTNHNND